MDKKHVHGDGDCDWEGDVFLHLKEEEQEKQKDGGESLTMPGDLASMKRKRGDESNLSDAEAKARAIIRKYYKQVKESEGFEFDELPAEVFEDMPFEIVVPLHLELGTNLKRSTERAIDAVKYYNKNHATSYVVDSVERANALMSGEVVEYYITFKGKKNIGADAAETFQAKIGENFGTEHFPRPVVVVKFCRLKRT